MTTVPTFKPTLSKTSSTRSVLQSSIARRVITANQTSTPEKLFGVAIILVISISIVYFLSYIVIEYGLFDGKNVYNQDSSFPEQHEKLELGVSGTNPVVNLNPGKFRVYLGFFVWFTMVMTGFGLEVFVWIMFLHEKWNTQLEFYWRFFQFVFPLLVMTSFGLATQHNYLCMPILVLSLFKAGFPETIQYLFSGLYNKRNSNLLRVIEILNGVGCGLHHSVTILYWSMILTEVIAVDPVVVGVTIPLLMQHWFVLIKYIHKWTYLILMLTSEAWAQWVTTSSLEHIHKVHWTGGITVGVMFVAHYLYLGAGFLSLFLSSKEDFHANQTPASQSLHAISLHGGDYDKKLRPRRRSMGGRLSSTKRTSIDLDPYSIIDFEPSTATSIQEGNNDVYEREKDDDGGGDTEEQDTGESYIYGVRDMIFPFMFELFAAFFHIVCSVSLAASNSLFDIGMVVYHRSAVG